MVKKFIFIFMLLFVFSTSYAYTSADFFKNLSYNQADFGKGEAVFELCNPTVSIANVDLTKDLIIAQEKIFGELKSYELYYLFKGDWKPIKDLTSISSSSCATIKLIGHYDMNYSEEGASVSIDWLPTLKFSGLNYTKDDWAWWNSSWDTKIRVNLSSVVATNLTDYPFYISFDTASLIDVDKMQSDCDDIRVLNSAEDTLLSYEIQDGCNSASTNLWVKIPLLNTDNSTYIYIYFNNIDAPNGENLTDLWSDYVAVYHFEDNNAGTSLYDSVHEYNLTSSATTATTATTGLFGNGYYSNLLYHASSTNLTFRQDLLYLGQNNFTGQVWYKSDVEDWSSTSPTIARIMVNFYNTSPANFMDGYYLTSANTMHYTQLGQGTNKDFANNTGVDTLAWQQFTHRVSITGGFTQALVNGTQLSNGNTGVLAFNGIPAQFSLCQDGLGGVGEPDGILDELRLMNFSITNDWAKMDFAQGVTTLYSIGSEEIMNVAPILEAYSIIPTEPTEEQDLIFNMTCSDVNSGDTITGYLEVFVNDVFNDSTSAVLVNDTDTNIFNLSSVYTSVGENWTGVFWCNDGEFNSTLYNITRTITEAPSPVTNDTISTNETLFTGWDTQSQDWSLTDYLTENITLILLIIIVLILALVFLKRI